MAGLHPTFRRSPGVSGASVRPRHGAGRQRALRSSVRGPRWRLARWLLSPSSSGEHHWACLIVAAMTNFISAEALRYLWPRVAASFLVRVLKRRESEANPSTIYVVCSRSDGHKTHTSGHAPHTKPARSLFCYDTGRPSLVVLLEIQHLGVRSNEIREQSTFRKTITELTVSSARGRTAREEPFNDRTKPSAGRARVPWRADVHTSLDEGARVRKAENDSSGERRNNANAGIKLDGLRNEERRS